MKKMHNGGRVLLVVLNLYVQIKIHVATFNTNHSVTDNMQTINCCFSPEASWFCSQVAVGLAIESTCQEKQTGYWLVWG